jgi:RNA polymerase sigma-B factor
MAVVDLRLRTARGREDARLFHRYLNDGDLRAREQLVARMMPLARQVASRYHRKSTSQEDLLQVASLGLLKAIDRFDPDRGTAFSSYAVPTIMGEIRRYFRDTGWALHVPRAQQELVLRAARVAEELTRKNGNTPSVAELAGALGETPEAVLEAREAALAHDALSLDAPAGPDRDDTETFTDGLGAIDDRFALVEDRSVLARAFAALPVRDRRVLGLRFQHDLTQKEIAERIGVSQMHVSRILKRSLERLHAVAVGRDGDLRLRRSA